jgi:hypothetical protein
MGLFRFVAGLFIVTGIGLIGLACHETYESLRVTVLSSSLEKTTAKLLGYHQEISRVRKTTGTGYTTGVWFPQPKVEYKGKTYTDPNIVPIEWYEPGDQVPISVVADGKGGVYVDTFYVRYTAAAIYFVLGSIFFGLTLLCWPMLSAATENDVDPIFEHAPVWFKHVKWAFIGIFGFAAVMASKEYLPGLIPDTWKPGNLEREFIQAMKKRDYAQAKNLLNNEELNLDYHEYDSYKNTLIMAALEGGHDEIARRMMQKKFDINARDWRGHSVIYYAVRYQNPFVLKELIERNASLESKDDLLLLAIAVKNREAVEILVEAGYPVDRKDPELRVFPSDMAIYAERPDILNYLVSKGAPTSAPREFIDVARDPANVSLQDENLRFGKKMTLKRWKALCEEEAQGRTN